MRWLSASCHTPRRLTGRRRKPRRSGARSSFWAAKTAPAGLTAACPLGHYGAMRPDLSPIEHLAAAEHEVAVGFMSHAAALDRATAEAAKIRGTLELLGCQNGTRWIDRGLPSRALWRDEARSFTH